MTTASIQKYIKTKCKIILLDETESTNNFLKGLADGKEDEKTVVIAKSQTNGKGRLGRKFYSPKNGLYMSILLRPKFSAEKSLFITTAAAVAVSEAIEKLSGKKTGIKWVNDIFINDKKVCGILSEASVNADGGLKYAILGIGVNISPPQNGFPKELENIAGAIFDNEPVCSEFSSVLAAKIIDTFFEIYNDFENCDFMKTYKEKSNVLGKNIYVLQANSKQKAKAIDIDEQARLVVEYENGEIKALSSGEVSVRI